MRKILLLFLLTGYACAQSFSGRSSDTIRVVPPFKFCLGEDNGQDACIQQTGANQAKLSGGVAFTGALNAFGITLSGLQAVVDLAPQQVCTFQGKGGQQAQYSSWYDINGLAWPMFSDGLVGHDCQTIVMARTQGGGYFDGNVLSWHANALPIPDFEPSRGVTLTDDGATIHNLNVTGTCTGCDTSPPQVFSGLPACAAATEGTRRSVTDSATATWGATITGSSTNHVLAYCDGTNWTVAGK